MPMSDPDVLTMNAEAALLVGGDDPLNAAVQALTEFIEGNEDAGVEVKALRIRAPWPSGRPPTCSRKRAPCPPRPGDPHASLALGETAWRRAIAIRDRGAGESDSGFSQRR